MNSKLNMCFPNSHFLDHRSTTTMHTAMCVLSCEDISCFISASIALGRENISCFPGRLQDVFSVTLFVFQDHLKTSSRRLQDVFAICLPKTSSRYLQDVFLKRLQNVFQDVFKTCLQDVLKDKKMLHWRRLEGVFKTSSVRLTKTNVGWGSTF